jgi:hypothetical protein
MTGDTSTIRLRAGATAILVFLVSVIATGLILSSGIDLQEIERGDVDIILPILSANPTVLAMVAWVVVIQGVLVSVFGIDLSRIFADGRSGLVFAPVALIGGAGLFIVEVLMVLGISQGLAPVYAGATGAEHSAIEATARALLLLRTRMLLVAGILWSLAVISFGREMLRSSEFSDWVGYWGYAAGVLGVIGGFFPLFDPLLVVGTLGQILSAIWVLIAGIMLLRSR